MASSSSLLPWVLLLCMLSALATHANGGGDLAIYWGWPQTNGTSSLSETCSSGNFKYAMIAFLSNFGKDEEIMPDLGDYCDAQSGGCKNLQYEIMLCKCLGVKVLLSIGGPSTNYTLNTEEGALKFAGRLYKTYLGGDPAASGPFGKVKFDGIDFYIRDTAETQFWDIVVKDLKDKDHNIILTASPECDYHSAIPLNTALETGLFSSVWPRFYDHPCDPFSFLWNTWTSKFNTSFYVGLPASPDAAEKGYLSPSQLEEVLKIAKKSPNYAGIMLWNRYWDVKNNYSTTIKPIVDSSSWLACGGLRDCITMY